MTTKDKAATKSIPKLKSMNFGDTIHYRRKQMGLSLRALGKIVNLSAAFICDVEKRNRYPSDKNLKNLSKALGVKITIPTCKCCGIRLNVGYRQKQ